MGRYQSAVLLSAILIGLAAFPSCWREGVKDGRVERERLSLQRAIDAEAAIRAATVAWSKAAQAKDLDKAVSFYSNDAIQFVDKSPMAQGKENIRAAWQQLLALPGPGLSFATTAVDVAHSAEMAWEYGTYDLATADKDGKITDVKGKYVVIWKKQFDETWKAVADIDNANQ
jgi:ketosteroid isomerase-like protein